MNIAKNFRILAELTNKYELSELPPDLIAKKFFKENRFIGSKERHLLSELFFNYVRNIKLIEFLDKKIFPPNPENNFSKMLINILICEFNIPTLSKIKPFALYTKKKTDKREVFLEFYRFFKKKRVFCQIKLTKTSIIKQIGLLERIISDESNNVKNRIEALAVKYSFRDDILSYLYEMIYGNFEALSEFAEFSFSSPGTVLRINNTPKNARIVVKELKKNEIPFHMSSIIPNTPVLEKRININSLLTYKRGVVEIQDEGSQIISFALAPKPNSTILDACAGAGGKTLHIADITKNQARIASCDISGRKLEELKKRAAKADARTIRTLKVSRDFNNPELEKIRFDFVLIDAPCSGFGTLRRNPDKKTRISMNDIEAFSRKQKEILAYYADRTKPGGMCLYATCSTLPKENEDVVDFFLKSNPDFEPVSPEKNLSKYGVQIELEAGEKFLTLYPEKYGTDGFFIALLKRKKIND